MSFKDEIVKVGRVRLFGFPGQLDSSMAHTIRERSELLAKRINDVDAEIGFTYPPIEILPYCILTPWEGDVIFARKSFRNLEEEGYIVVQLSAPTILAFPDEQLDAILAHEFLHYVWDTINFLSAAAPGTQGVLVSTPEDKHPDYMKSSESYEAIDLDQQAVDSDWLPARLVVLYRRLSGSKKDLFIEGCMLDVFREWLRRGYPTKKLDPDYRYKGPLNLDEAVIERARQLGLLKASAD
jgi:hypothetical protein